MGFICNLFVLSTRAPLPVIQFDATLNRQLSLASFLRDELADDAGEGNVTKEVTNYETK